MNRKKIEPRSECFTRNWNGCAATARLSPAWARRNSEWQSQKTSTPPSLCGSFLPHSGARRPVLKLSNGLCGLILVLLFIAAPAQSAPAKLPFSTVFRGTAQFERLVKRAEEGNWSALPIGQRVATVGKSLVGTPYASFTLEIDDRIEAASANLEGMDCWTFFEISLAFARMISEPRDSWTPQNFLHYIELDRYRGGICTGAYLSRLHYLEDWAVDNQQRGLVTDITHSLGGVRVRHEANEMTHGWKEYRYLKANPSLLTPLARMEEHVTALPMFCIPLHRVAAAEKNMQDGDIICIISRDIPPYVSTSHVGLAVRDANGTLHFMHASSPRNYGKVVVDDELIRYLHRYSTDLGVMVVRPLK